MYVGRNIRSGHIDVNHGTPGVVGRVSSYPLQLDAYKRALAGPVLARAQILEHELDETGATDQSKWVRWETTSRSNLYIVWPISMA